MLDRGCKLDRKNDLATKVTRRKSARRVESYSTDPKPSSSSSSSASLPPASSEETTYSEEALVLPLHERYQAQKKGRSPFHCVACKRNFSRSSLSLHIKSKHHGRAAKVNCCVCHQKFSGHRKALEHFSQYHKIYDCLRCAEKFSEFDRLKSHLKSAHDGTDWPWICGFCDLVLLYELDFQIHIRQHTGKPPFACPLCAKPYGDTSRLREHLAQVHMPRSHETSGEIIMMSSQKRSGDSKAKSAASAESTRDENAVNREIAALLLNLHASRSNEMPAQAASKAEDLSFRSETAIDLSKAKADMGGLNTPLPASISKLAKSSMNGSIDLSKNGLGSNATGFTLPTTPANPYSFYPSLASMAGLNPTTLATMNSNYLLQNLLLGKMQQMAAVASTSSSSVTPTSSSSNSLAFPTQPLPAQTLSLPSVNSLKPPPSVMKSAITNSNGVSLTSSMQNVPSSLHQLSDGTPSTNIPLLCGQIVAQLNGLLFLVHSLNNSQVEMSLQTQLTAIYSRLQDVVTMVEQAKKQQEDKEPRGDNIHKQLEKMKESKQKEEEKIAKHIQDYQRALMQQHEGKLPSQIAALKESPGVASLLKKHQHANMEQQRGDLEMQEVESSTSASGSSLSAAAAAARRRRGRPPKNSNMDLSYSPPEKRARGSTEHQLSSGAESTTSQLLANGHTMGDLSGKGGAGGKGIRNRVFCGECAGCLKNDDCGRCRYCQDKTKFGGQNRLRQKCLHRRCQMDTHRKRTNNAANSASNNNGSASSASSAMMSSFKDLPSARQSPSPNTIYSGVDLARLAATAAEKIGEIKSDDERSDDVPDSKLKNGEKELLTASESGETARRSTRSRPKSGDQVLLRKQSVSDDELSDGSGGDHPRGPGGRTQSRIDKWKAKHEAMLKMASEGKKKRKRELAVDEESEGEAEKREEVDEDDEEEEEPEIPNIEPNGVCIDFERKAKPHTRHSAAIQQQQALSV